MLIFEDKRKKKKSEKIKKKLNTPLGILIYVFHSDTTCCNAEAS